MSKQPSLKGDQKEVCDGCLLSIRSFVAGNLREIYGMWGGKHIQLCSTLYVTVGLLNLYALILELE